jgi:YbgC/YbaW family acyl-CoA thioester hydrolase
MDRPLHRHVCEVPFGDTDASGWLHFPNVFRYLEAAEHAFLRSRGLSVFDRSQGGWPRVHVECDYRKPLTAGDAIEVRLALDKIGTSSLHWSFEIRKEDEPAAVGKMVTVRVDAAGRPLAIDDAIRTALAG